MARTASKTKNYRAQNVNSAEVEFKRANRCEKHSLQVTAPASEAE